MTLKLGLGAAVAVAAGLVVLATRHGGRVVHLIEGLACDVSALDPAEQKQAETLRERLRGATREVRELEDGYAFRIDSSVSLTELAQFMTFERRCCSFFAFALEVAPGDCPMWLRLTGRPGVKEMIKTALKL